MLLLRAVPAGLAVSVVAWAVVSVAPYLRYVLAILVGIAVGDTISRLSRRRTNRVLDVAAVVVLACGLIAVETFRLGGPAFLVALGADPAVGISLIVPLVIASIAAIARMR
ncbi:MAG TPA: hypothetical protein VFB58_08165 [Chloroflexota bacterium]|nr:hypothetical protein [Chloroflexota bacterium]